MLQLYPPNGGPARFRNRTSEDHGNADTTLYLGNSAAIIFYVERFVRFDVDKAGFHNYTLQNRDASLRCRFKFIEAVASRGLLFFSVLLHWP